ncbi:MAG: hypothetical protein K0R57_6653 [Paenibacillaceae bacterium]|jgi:hypothetical protein|nr:hypothetical protein [Paenibacillaceae bacterium]
MKQNIVNIVHFIRWVEPRHPGRDLYEPLAEQLKLANQYGFKATFLLQYDALLDPRFTGVLKEQDPELIEIGGWFEVVQQLVEAAGLVWRGREGFSWDYHSHVGFLAGYAPQERERLLDLYMEKFRAEFGRYPQAVGSWFIDAHSLAYLRNKYGVKAACICRDQWGTDGYNLWGGYFSGGYYPSRSNMLAPAQSQEMQIDLPVFRMLGSDPIYQYDMGLAADTGFNPVAAQAVSTMEPIYPESGGDPRWVEWFMAENFNELALPFGYAQLGQENAFGWSKMEKGLKMQWEILDRLVKKGEVTLQHVSETGELFRAAYDQTPATSVVATRDWAEEGHQSAWYCSRFYRANLFAEHGQLWIRDIHLFAEDYAERYLEEPCPQKQAYYDNLPVVDGYRWSGNGTRAGLYLQVLDGEGSYLPAEGQTVTFSRQDDELRAELQLVEGALTICCRERKIEISSSLAKPWALALRWGSDEVPVTTVGSREVSYRYNGYSYKLCAGNGRFEATPDKELRILPHDNHITLAFSGASHGY